ncbi:MAG: relaxase/mobilization nuclease domain-containing protein [Oscillospiraceae bacterium]|nr:relaxase/mobilization nuclease domain-containing protein [Oscillospiraceae bacterium]
MAATGFWPIYKNLRATLAYADNPDKTTPKEYVDDDLYAALRYAGNDYKTDKQLYVGGINCSRQNAFAEMVAVQRRFGLRGKVVGYHGIQSFREGEVTPEEAFAIGRETARRMWGDRYQVLVTLHLNTENLHCHFVVNPVSFKDGAKFQNKIGDHKELRRVSDEICREHRLSVLENSNFYGNKKAYWINKVGKKTHRDLLREDVEYCLSYAGNMDQFVSQLRGLGYEYDYRRGSVRAPGWERAVRLRNLGYTTEGLRERFKDNLCSPGHYYQWNTHLPYRPKRFPLLELERKLQFSVEHSHDAATVLVDLLFLMLLLLLQLQKEENTKVRPLSPTLRQEIAKFDELQREYKFLTDNGIHTTVDLTDTMADLSRQIKEKETQRQKCRNQLRRNTDPAREAVLKDEAKAISKELTPLREQLRTAQRIAQRYPKLQQLLKTERAMEMTAHARERERS